MEHEQEKRTKSKKAKKIQVTDKEQTTKQPHADLPITQPACDELTIEPDEITQACVVLQEENKQLQDKILRQMAEFDNYKKRTAKEKDELYSRAKAETVEGLLVVLDNFERALQATDPDQADADQTFLQGIEMIFSQLVQALEKLGIAEISALNQPFDPGLHNAIQQVQNDELDENVVVEVLQKGYRLGDKVIRHAMVVVANP